MRLEFRHVCVSGYSPRLRVNRRCRYELHDGRLPVTLSSLCSAIPWSGYGEAGVGVGREVAPPNGGPTLLSPAFFPSFLNVVSMVRPGLTQALFGEDR